MRHLRFFTTSLLISLTVIGCDVESEPVDSEERFDVVMLEPDEDAGEVGVRAFSRDELTEEVPGEDPDDPSAVTDCVYVQWCNAPGPNGTICRLRSGCVANTTTVNECIADTNAVCGGPVSPWYLY